MRQILLALAVHWSSSLSGAVVSELCREQIEVRRVPVACYQEVHKQKRFQDSAAAFLGFLDQRCLQALAHESRLSYLDDLVRHPLITKTCRTFADRRRERVRYALQDNNPMEVIESLIDEGQGL